MIMKRICLLKNTIQEYEWGSFTAIAELLGEPSPSEKPQAELWMGAHPKAPSLVKVEDQWVSLFSVIEENPKGLLGETVTKKFHGRLPYLFKVLAAAKPLSIQAHPNLTQAKEGFKRENDAGIPINAPNRNYIDDNHKPEIICALTPFWALNGFRAIDDIVANMTRYCPTEMVTETKELAEYPDANGLKNFFNAIMTMNPERVQSVIEETIQIAKQSDPGDPIPEWMVSLHKAYPSDIGVLSPLYLNLICLSPGEAMFLAAGQLHAYLDGLGMELMANSDNVLRGGLTPKHMDVPELIKCLNFEEKKLEILTPEKYVDRENVYAGQAEEFVLSVIEMKDRKGYISRTERSAEILFCTDGEGKIRDLGNDEAISFSKGGSAMIPAAVEKYAIEGNVTVYKAAVPI